ncbi:hypothetical protein C0J52_27676 [Blattella germanica]|nr:hypothetical protein C0J52_27676 [Blattella germanica]
MQICLRITRTFPSVRTGSQKGGRRCIGRSRKRCLEDIEEDIREMGIRTWRRRAQDRGEWATIVRQALVLQGS